MYSTNKKARVFYPKYNVTFMDSVRTCFERESCIDLVFICDDNVRVRSHKMVMASVSDYLKTIIEASPEDIVYISLPGTSHREIKLLLNLFYHGVADVTSKELPGLRKIVSLLGIEFDNSSGVPTSLNKNIVLTHTNYQNKRLVDQDVEPLSTELSGKTNKKCIAALGTQSDDAVKIQKADVLADSTPGNSPAEKENNEDSSTNCAERDASEQHAESASKEHTIPENTKKSMSSEFTEVTGPCFMGTEPAVFKRAVPVAAKYDRISEITTVMETEPAVSKRAVPVAANYDRISETTTVMETEPAVSKRAVPVAAKYDHISEITTVMETEPAISKRTVPVAAKYDRISEKTTVIETEPAVSKRAVPVAAKYDRISEITTVMDIEPSVPVAGVSRGIFNQNFVKKVHQVVEFIVSIEDKDIVKEVEIEGTSADNHETVNTNSETNIADDLLEMTDETSPPGSMSYELVLPDEASCDAENEDLNVSAIEDVNNFDTWIGDKNLVAPKVCNTTSRGTEILKKVDKFIEEQENLLNQKWYLKSAVSSAPGQDTQSSPIFDQTASVPKQIQHRPIILLSQHSRQKYFNPGPTFPCSYCGLTFADPEFLEKHFKHCRKNSNKSFLCDVCGKGFVNRMCLSRHIPICSVEKKFQCYHCNKKFSGRKNVKVHIEEQHIIQNAVTCSMCDLSFNTVRCLKTHEKLHVKRRRFKCDICGKMFAHAGSLRIHVEHHGGIKTYKCKTCSSAFSTLSTLCKHKRRKHSA